MGDFTITKGDTCYITYIKLDDDGVQVDLVTGDSCTFSAKKNLRQTEYDIQVVSTNILEGQMIIKLEPTDTNITLADYYYDLELIEGTSGDVFTVAKGTLTIDWEVTVNE